jgi:hypothetical protein
MVGERPFDVGRVSVGAPLWEVDSVIGGEIRPLLAPGFIGAESTVQKEYGVALPLDLVPSLDAWKFDVLAHHSSPLIAAQTLLKIAHFARLLEPLFNQVPGEAVWKVAGRVGTHVCW